MLTCPYCKKETEKEKWDWREVTHGSFGMRRYDGCHSCVSAISRKYNEDALWLGIERNLTGKKHTRLIREALFKKEN